METFSNGKDLFYAEKHSFILFTLYLTVVLLKISPNAQRAGSVIQDLGSWNFFFANNGLGGFLGPNRKVFHHGTLCEHFQGVVIAFRSWPGVKMGLKLGEKLIQFFCP